MRMSAGAPSQGAGNLAWTACRGRERLHSSQVIACVAAPFSLVSAPMGSTDLCHRGDRGPSRRRANLAATRRWQLAAYISSRLLTARARARA